MKKFIKIQSFFYFVAIILLCGSLFVSCNGNPDKTTTETNTVQMKKDSLPPLDTNKVNSGRTEVIVTGKTPPSTPN